MRNVSCTDTAKHLDVWFYKPRLYRSSAGRWCCLVQEDKKVFPCVVGSGITPLDAFEDMKRAVVAYLKRIHRVEKVEFV